MVTRSCSGSRTRPTISPNSEATFQVSPTLVVSNDRELTGGPSATAISRGSVQGTAVSGFSVGGFGTGSSGVSGDAENADGVGVSAFNIGLGTALYE